MTLGPKRYALLVVDMQNDFCHQQGVYPKNGISIENVNVIIQNQILFIKFCRRQKIPVIFIGWTIRADSEGNPIDAGRILLVRPFLKSGGLRKGTWGAEFIKNLPPPDYVVEKARPSGFYNTSLEVLLGSLGANTVILAGVFTNQCIESTARDAWARDLDIILLEDCMAASSSELHSSSIKSLSVIAQVYKYKDFIKSYKNI